MPDGPWRAMNRMCDLLDGKAGAAALWTGLGTSPYSSYDNVICTGFLCRNSRQRISLKHYSSVSGVGPCFAVDLRL